MTIRMALAVTTISVLMPCGLVYAQAPSIAAELQPLQGSWEGVMVGQEAAGKISITITGNSLDYKRQGSAQWYKAAFTLPPGTYPPQIQATIKDCPEPCDDIGKVVYAIFKIEDGTLTLVGIQGSGVEPPKSFGEIPGFDSDRSFRYKLKKAQPLPLRQ